MLGWKEGLSLSPRQAKRLYALLAGAMGVGFLATLAPVSPMKALVYGWVTFAAMSVGAVLVIADPVR